MDAIYDCHLHTEFSADSETPVRDQLEKAISLGMKEICITDHHDPGSEFCPEKLYLKSSFLYSSDPKSTE